MTLQASSVSNPKMDPMTLLERHPYLFFSEIREKSARDLKKTKLLQMVVRCLNQEKMGLGGGLMQGMLEKKTTHRWSLIVQNFFQ